MGFGRMTFQHAKSCWMTFWQTKESSRIHGLYCIINYHQLSSYEIWSYEFIWIYMMCIILLSQDIPNLWISPFEPLMPLYPSTTSKTWRLERGRRGERPVARIDTKKIPASSFQKAAIYYICVALLFCWLHIVRGDRPPDQIMTFPKYLQWTPIQVELLDHTLHSFLVILISLSNGYVYQYLLTCFVSQFGKTSNRNH